MPSWQERGYDAVVVRDEANLRRWLTGAMRVFDYTGEYPHAAFITADACYLHTDSRYFNTFEENLPEGVEWKLDMESIAIPRWVAERSAPPRAAPSPSRMTCKSGSIAASSAGLRTAPCARPCRFMHGDLQLMRAVKDAEEIELMRHAQSITDAAFAHMCTVIRPASQRSSSAPSLRPSCSTTVPMA